ncbi:FAD binding domain-containing protein [Aspergillus costaricaensis CBS 115574]|uniref:FAD binding domain-containing protein n=1 Tax=Aspergillus costaricaensis CBS 115574 TaxID=1448317 RepID=A0ACD1IJN1_9EURO|nr:FAD binding domain-containing protein [Aspergillus costaricaensis CBS 115574]RAK90233.1 FAD binding domain-containing protein [Aspergillus costaricaensis CBS 115574]
MAEPCTVKDHLKMLESFLSPGEIIRPTSPDYQSKVETWAAQKQLNPHIVLRPTTVDSLSKAIAYLYSTNLDFAIYGHGFMSASASDVLVNMSAFNGFHLDRNSELATVGAGQTWSDVYRKLNEVAPEYGIVGARTPCVGVAGTIISGGFSWLSREYGCISDPANMLDAKVVKYDGSVVWASSEPDLLWALRGGGGGFGVVVEVVLRVFPYPQNIWAGPILIPREQLEVTADEIARFVSRPLDPKISMFLYVVKKRLLKSIGADSDMLVLHVFDACGEAHGRVNFQWALNIPGAIDQTKVTTFAGVADLQDKVHIAKGTMKQFWSPLLLRELSKDTIINAVHWSEDIGKLDESLSDCTYLIFELLCSRDPAGGVASCAWPRPQGVKHILLMGPGCPADAGCDHEDLVRDLAIKAGSRVLGENADLNYLPNGYEKFYDAEKIWRPHFAQLQNLRRRYDPLGRFKGAVTHSHT